MKLKIFFYSLILLITTGCEKEELIGDQMTDRIKIECNGRDGYVTTSNFINLTRAYIPSGAEPFIVINDYSYPTRDKEGETKTIIKAEIESVHKNNEWPKWTTGDPEKIAELNGIKSIKQLSDTKIEITLMPNTGNRINTHNVIVCQKAAIKDKRGKIKYIKDEKSLWIFEQYPPGSPVDDFYKSNMTKDEFYPLWKAYITSLEQR